MSDKNGDPFEKETSKTFWDSIGAISSLLSVIVSVLALCVGLHQYKSQIDQLKYEREQKIKLDRPIISIEKQAVSDFKEMKQLTLFIKNVGIRPADNLVIKTIILRKINDFTPFEYNQQDYSTSFGNPIFKDQEVSFFKNFPIIMGAEYFFKITVIYNDRDNIGNYSEDFYFRWKHFRDPDYSQENLYGIEVELVNEVNKYLLNNKNTSK